MEAIIKEFDRNTAEHFVGQKRKIEEPNSIIQEICNEEDQELQKKRMKIEYIKKLLPSSFGNFIKKNICTYLRVIQIYVTTTFYYAIIL